MLLPLAIMPALAASGSARANDLGAWGDYAMAQMLPQYEWVDHKAANAAAPTVFEVSAPGVALASAGLIESILPDLGFSVRASRNTPAARLLDFTPNLLPRFTPGVEGSLLAPALTQSFGTDGELRVSALFARQHFASWGFGTGIGDEFNFYGGETSTGQGAAIAWRDALGPTLSYRVSWQSRIDMNPLQSVRGVYADAADFDTPSVVAVGLDWNFAPSWSVGFDASRVAYGDLNAFTSANLPRNLLSLLGDDGSPELGWRDLTVYGAQLGWQPSPLTRWTLRYSTQQQPRPTSSILDRALAERYSDSNWSLGLESRAGDFGWWQLSASYSPAQYFLGVASFADDDLSGRLLEVEALWTYPF